VETKNITETVDVAGTVEKSTDATILQASDIANGPKTDVKTIAETLPTKFEEKPVSVSSSDVKTAAVIDVSTNDETVKVDETPPASTEDKSNDEMSTVKIVETAGIQEVKPAEMIVIKTIEKPTEGVHHEKFVDEPAATATVGALRVNAGLDTQSNTNKNNVPAEMVAVKTVEKPTFADALKAAKNPAEVQADAVKAAADAQSVDLSKNPIETVPTKTMENPPTAVRSTGTIENSGITTSTKLLEVQEDTKKQSIPSDENIVSRSSAPKQTEMVAVKTVENSATVKSVVSVKTVIKPGIPKTTHSANSSSLIMRKVGDRKPLPTIKLEVATPKVL